MDKYSGEDVGSDLNDRLAKKLKVEDSFSGSNQTEEIEYGVLIAQFSQLTGEEDETKILAALDKHEWNLERAVSNFLDDADAKYYYHSSSPAYANNTHTNTTYTSTYTTRNEDTEEVYYSDNEKDNDRFGEDNQRGEKDDFSSYTIDSEKNNTENERNDNKNENNNSNNDESNSNNNSTNKNNNYNDYGNFIDKHYFKPIYNVNDNPYIFNKNNTEYDPNYATAKYPQKHSWNEPKDWDSVDEWEAEKWDSSQNATSSNNYNFTSNNNNNFTSNNNNNNFTSNNNNNNNSTSNNNNNVNFTTNDNNNKNNFTSTSAFNFVSPNVDNTFVTSRNFCQLAATGVSGWTNTINTKRVGTSLKLLCVAKLSNSFISYEELVKLLELCENVDVHAFHQLVYQTAARNYFTIRNMASYIILPIEIHKKVESFLEDGWE